MPIIVKNNKKYGGTYSNATDVNYDNSVSKLNADTSQEALDELANGLKNTSPVDNLLSTSTTLPLSANQGKVLDEKISTVNDSLGEVSSKLGNFYFEQQSLTSDSENTEVNIVYADWTDGLYLVMVTDAEYAQSSDKGLVLLLDVRNAYSYRHIISSNGITILGHNARYVVIKGGKNYLLKSIRLIKY